MHTIQYDNNSIILDFWPYNVASVGGGGGVHRMSHNPKQHHAIVTYSLVLTNVTMVVLHSNIRAGLAGH